MIGVEQAYRKNPTPANLKKWMAASSVMKGDSARLVTLKNVSFKRAFNLKEDQSYSVLLTKFAKERNRGVWVSRFVGTRGPFGFDFTTAA